MAFCRPETTKGPDMPDTRPKEHESDLCVCSHWRGLHDARRRVCLGWCNTCRGFELAPLDTSNPWADEEAVANAG